MDNRAEIDSLLLKFIVRTGQHSLPKCCIFQIMVALKENTIGVVFNILYL